MRSRTVRRWSWVHRWTSLVCTIFMLMLCITGFPLIFHHELDDLLHVSVAPSEQPEGTPSASLDRIVAGAVAHVPGHVPHFLVWDDDDPHVVTVSLGASIDADPSRNRVVRMDERTAAFLDAPDVQGRLTYVLLRIHADLFADLPGKLFLGFVGILFIAAIVSGIVIYGPWMRKLDFGTVRSKRRPIVRWLDLHNLIGVTTMAWAIVVGVTGVINSWADLAITLWQSDQLAQMTAAYRDAPRPDTLSSVQAALDRARKDMPDMSPLLVAYPGTAYTSRQHYAVFMHGNTPLTGRLLRPALIDASDGTLTDSRDLPWYLTTLLVSQPLHFGDYGGMALKIVWALLDIATIIVLGSGLYLWFAKRRTRAPSDPGGAERRVVAPAASPAT